MKDNFEFININDWTTIKISGDQILDYLNGIITFDLMKLNNEDTVKNMFLTSKAKIRSIFWIKLLDNVYYIYSPPVFRDNLIEDLLKYKLDMKVKLEDITQETPPLFLKRGEPKEINLCQDTFHFVNLNDIPQGDMLLNSSLDNWLVLNGDLPFKYYLDQNPFETGNNDAITLEKGCFLGQEPLSRMYHRGKPRKYLYQITLSEQPLGNELQLLDEIVGEIIVTANQIGNFPAIAYINSSVSDFDQILHNGKLIFVNSKIGNYPTINR